MESKEFIKLCIKTESRTETEPLTPLEWRLLHMALGLATEAGEILDAFKKRLFYGKPLDLINIVEEMGDSEWYQGIGLDALKLTHGNIWRTVIEKLRTRYPEKFNRSSAISRDLEAERRTIERSTKRCKILRRMVSNGGNGNTPKGKIKKHSGKNVGSVNGIRPAN